MNFLEAGLDGGVMNSVATLFKAALTAFLLTALGACASQPSNPNNVCLMFEDRRAWYKAAEQSERRWGVPVHVSMAFIYQESAYQARVRPDRTRILWVVPWRRPSSAYGYAQALDATWAEYQRETGNRFARRSNFTDAIDFIGWYNRNSYRRNGIARDDAYNLYLAYHEGNAGFARRSYAGNDTLLATANRVQQNADRYKSQFAQCEEALGRNWFQRLFS